MSNPWNAQSKHSVSVKCLGVFWNKGFPVAKESPLKIPRDINASLEMPLVLGLGKKRVRELMKSVGRLLATFPGRVGLAGAGELSVVLNAICSA